MRQCSQVVHLEVPNVLIWPLDAQQKQTESVSGVSWNVRISQGTEA